MIPSRGNRFDLHMHSARSDGRFEPEEVLDKAAAGGLDVLALTDHDLATIIDPGEHAVGGRRIHVLAGAEVSGVHEGREFHLLVYFPGEVPARFRAFCEAQARNRVGRYTNAVASTGLTGVRLPDDEARAGRRSVTRHHLARAMVEAGHVGNVPEAFALYLSHAHGHVPMMEFLFVDAIRLAKELGGVTSWAHPPVAAVRDHLATFVAAGLQGLEGIRPRLSRGDRKFYRKWRTPMGCC